MKRHKMRFHSATEAERVPQCFRSFPQNQEGAFVKVVLFLSHVLLSKTFIHLTQCFTFEGTSVF